LGGGKKLGRAEQTSEAEGGDRKKGGGEQVQKGQGHFSGSEKFERRGRKRATCGLKKGFQKKATTSLEVQIERKGKGKKEKEPSKRKGGGGWVLETKKGKKIKKVYLFKKQAGE